MDSVTEAGLGNLRGHFNNSKKPMGIVSKGIIVKKG